MMLFTWVWATLLIGGCMGHQRAWLDTQGGYKDIVVAISPTVNPEDCNSFFTNLQASLTSFSDHLWVATEQQLHLGEIDVLIPPSVVRGCSLNPLHLTPPSWQTWATADIRITSEGWMTEQYGPIGSRDVGVGVHQPQGCGLPGDYITLSPKLISHLQAQRDPQQNLDHLGRALVSGWARYRWGVLEERGYLGDTKYPKVQDDTPTGCNTPPSNIESDETVTVHSKTNASNANTSLMYTVKDPQVWGFCDSTNHDPDAPTPHNLACSGLSVWDIMEKHPDFKVTTTEVTRTGQYYKGTTYDKRHKHYIENDSVNEYNENTTTEYSEASIDNNSYPSNSDDNHSYVMNSRAPSYKQAMNVSHNGTENNSTLSDINVNRVRWRRTAQQKADKASPTTDTQSVYTRPSLVAAHIAPQSPHQRINIENSTKNLSVSSNSPNSTKPTSTGRSNFSQEQVEPVFQSSPRKLSNPSGLTKLPPHPSIRFMSSAPPSIVVALDLSESAVRKVNIEQIRGGLLRWLWGLPDTVRVGVIAAYNNASYPLTVAPLEVTSQSPQVLEDILALLPYQDEVEDGVYGGPYCLSCVLEEAIKVLEIDGVSASSGTLVLASCQPLVTDTHKRQIKSLSMTIHTVALCASADLALDQLASGGNAWAVPAMSSPAGSGDAEVQFLRVLQAITHETMVWPEDESLVTIEEDVYIIGRRDMKSFGPYSSVKRSMQFEVGDNERLLVLTTSSDAKVVEISNMDNKLQVIRDTPRRYWTTLANTDFESNYKLKFLSSSLSFPIFARVTLYEKRSRSTQPLNGGRGDVRIVLKTNNDFHNPIQPGAPFLIVWAELTQNGRPVRGASVRLVVTLFSSDILGNSTMVLLDDGSTEPDLRRGDGIYTRYLTQLPRAGRYSLMAIANDNFGTASIPLPNSSAEDGVRLDKVSTGHFSVMSASISVTVGRVTNQDLIPPSRITDLAVNPLGDATINLTWTAPGGDMDYGTAHHYELKMYTEREALNDDRFNSSGILVYCVDDDDHKAPTPRPAPHGSPQHCLARLPFSNLRWYFGLRTTDSSNNTGKISNVVSAWVSEPTTLSSSNPTDPSLPAQTVVMSTVTTQGSGKNITVASTSPWGNTWRIYIISGIAALAILMLIGATVGCICCCRRARANAEKDPDRPIYKIYVNNAYIQEEDGEIKVVSNGKVMDDKDPGQDWVNSLGKYSGGEALRSEQPDVTANASEMQLGESRPPASMKYTAPVRFGVLTNGSIMRDQKDGSSSSSSKPSDDVGNDDFKYRDLSETTSNSTTDGGGSGSTSSGATEIQQSTFIEVPPMSGHQTLGIPVNEECLNIPKVMNKPGPTVISIHNPGNGYSSDEEGGFRPRSVIHGPGPRRYLPNHFSSFRYLPPPLEYQSNGLPNIDYPTSHTISRATSTLPHGTVRSVKKRRHISFV